MMPVPADAPLRERLATRVGPELIASILVVAVVVVGLSVALSGRKAGGIGPSPLPSAAAVVPSGPPLTSSASPSTAQVPPSTPPTPLMEIVDRLLEQRAALVVEISKPGTDAAAIVDILSSLNASLALLGGPVSDLAANPETADLATRLQGVETATSEAIRRTQRASITNARAYRAGAAEIVDTLKPLVAIRRELAALADPGVAPAPNSSAGQAGATPAPSGTTP
jgi:hypothetical protein